MVIASAFRPPSGGSVAHRRHTANLVLRSVAWFLAPCAAGALVVLLLLFCACGHKLLFLLAAIP